jgi:hypothetical protein
MIESQENFFLGVRPWDLIAAVLQVPSMIGEGAGPYICKLETIRHNLVSPPSVVPCF